MLPNEVFALNCRAYYDEIGLVVDERNGEFSHCPYPKGDGDKGYYLLWGHHQQQGLLQSEDIGRCCFFNGHVKKWLIECDPIPDNFFHLWDLYEEFSGQYGRENLNKIHEVKNDSGVSAHASRAGKVPHAKKDDLGRSVQGVRNAERLNSLIHAERDESGRSLHGIRAGEALNKLKDEKGRSVNAVKAGESTHSVKDSLGRSVHGVKSARKMNSQKWEDPDHPELGAQNPGNLVRMQKRRGYPYGKQNRRRVLQ